MTSQRKECILKKSNYSWVLISIITESFCYCRERNEYSIMVLNKASVFLFPADNSVNLRRISFAYPINVKYDCLAFREDMLLTHSTMIDLFQSKNNSLKSRISVTPTFQRLIKAIRISPGFPGLLLAIENILASNSF